MQPKTTTIKIRLMESAASVARQRAPTTTPGPPT
jgi:hypothetical protein